MCTGREGEPLELFDLEADPLEEHNCLREHPTIVNALRDELKGWLSEPRLSPYQD